jgi:hypothetical protein
VLWARIRLSEYSFGFVKKGALGRCGNGIWGLKPDRPLRANAETGWF